MEQSKAVVSASATNVVVPVEPLSGGKSAVVTFRAGLTLNMGNYETARVDVGIDFPCDADKIDTAYKRAKEWVTTRLQDEVSDIRQKRSAF